MTVYAVVNAEGDLLGLFSTRERADAWMDRQVGRGVRFLDAHWRSSLVIDAWVVDADEDVV